MLHVLLRTCMRVLIVKRSVHCYMHFPVSVCTNAYVSLLSRKTSVMPPLSDRVAVGGKDAPVDT